MPTKKLFRRRTVKRGGTAAGTKARTKTDSIRRSSTHYWSASVMKHSDALDLDQGLFQRQNPHDIALSLKRSAQKSRRRKGTPYQSAMSMLNFYINRAGKQLSPGRKRLLERAKPELRKAFGRTER